MRPITGIDVFRPKVNRLATFHEEIGTCLVKGLQKPQIICVVCFPGIHLPTAEAKLMIRWRSKYPGGKIEFSLWITSGDSPFSMRLRSSSREAALSAARLFRLMLLDGFIGSGGLVRHAANHEHHTGADTGRQPPSTTASNCRARLTAMNQEKCS